MTVTATMALTLCHLDLLTALSFSLSLSHALVLVLDLLVGAEPPSSQPLGVKCVWEGAGRGWGC